MIDVSNASYVASCVDEKKIPQHPGCEIVLLGRSNVGKSTFINRFTKRKKLAYFSQTPGKTQTMNIYYINDDLTFVDMPGYGYAQVSYTMREKFIKMIEKYLHNREELKLAIQFIDFKVGPTEDDLIMLDFLEQMNQDYIIICTKVDKIAKTKQKKQKEHLKSILNTNKPIYFYSEKDINTLYNIYQAIEDKIS